MKKQLPLLFIVLLCLTAVYGFQKWTIAHLQQEKETTLVWENIAYSCPPPSDSGVKDIKTDEATIFWEDDSGTVWEYIVQSPSDPYPTGAGTSSATKEVVVTQDQNGNNLLPSTSYEWYVRTNCGADGESVWEGPFGFKTLCAALTVPFTEGFNTASTTFDCWTIVDGNEDATSPTGNNIWKQSSSSPPYEGDRRMDFNGDSNTNHDDWLISPAITLNGGIYAVSWYYRTANADNEMEVLLSQNGTDLSQFTTVLSPEQIYLSEGSSMYSKKTIYIKGGISGDVHIAWHMVASTYTAISLDMVYIREVDCVAPDEDEITVTDIKTDEVTLEWVDNDNTQWEYYVLPALGGVPAGSGTLTSGKQVTVTRTNGAGGANLQPDTEYEFWVRSLCGNNGYSEWIGPIYFKTENPAAPCNMLPVPFWEGFNSDSSTVDCWQMIDNNKDKWAASVVITNNCWNIIPFAVNTYEGDRTVSFMGTRKSNDDWLISPTFALDATKFYRLQWHQAVQSTKDTLGMSVLLSDSGTALTDFTTVLIPPRKIIHQDEAYYSETKAFFTGVGGAVNIAWHIDHKGGENPPGVVRQASVSVYVDNVFLEEVIGCPEPALLESKDEETDKVTIFWEDDFGSAWEYVVQEAGGTIPLGAGTATAAKENTITQDYNGNNLLPNKDYEFYVRTDCGSGEYSIWSGPFLFTTACDAYTIPFVEDFETLSRRCWNVFDGNRDLWNPPSLSDTNAWSVSSEARFNGRPGTEQQDDWLISPTILSMDPGMYVLKYQYRVTRNGSAISEFEVLLSNQGIDPTDFTTVIVPSTVHSSSMGAGVYVEEVVFFNGVAGDINLAWHVTSVDNAQLHIDDVVLRKVETCPEPYHVEVTEQTSTTITIEWQQDSGITSWEVIVVDYHKDETATPVQTVNVTGIPEATITGLDKGKAYKIYVRAKCTDNESHSDWSTPVVGKTVVGENNDCSGAIEIPVNSSPECVEMVSGTFLGALDSTVPEPSCDIPTVKKDVWFKFTATHDTHLLRIDGLSSTTHYGALYDQPCSLITTTALECFLDENLVSGTYQREFSDLTPGQTYYIRLAVRFVNNLDHHFTLCITTPASIVLSPSGDLYTTDELVKEVFVQSEPACELVSNIKYEIGDDNDRFNTLAHFDKANTDFPFEEGVLLGTSHWTDILGPHRGYILNMRNKLRLSPWRTPELDRILDEVRGGNWGTDRDKVLSVLEFDFIPLKDTISFEYLFASDAYSYGNDCYSDREAMFVAWLKEESTGNETNLAVIPSTNDTPISTNYISDPERIDSACLPANKAYLWKYFYGGDEDPFSAPVNLSAMTVPMQTKSFVVTPGEKYHIKLIVMDRYIYPLLGGPDILPNSSAVFLNGGSLDLGNDLSLGEDLSIENGNALCYGDTRVINIETAVSERLKKEYTWYKDGVLIPGANTPDLEVSEAGEYKVVMKLTDLNCELTDTIKVEMHPVISEHVKTPREVEICRYSLQERTVDLREVESEIFSETERSDYKVSYYLTAEAAEQGSATTIDGISYVVEGTEDTVLYLRVEDINTGCHEIFVLPVKIEQGVIPDKPSDVAVCAEYIFPETADNQYYYTEPSGQGTVYQAGDVFAEPGEHTIYLLQVNSEEGCYEEIAYQLNITAPVMADIFEDETLSCEYYQLAPLSEHNRYYTEPEGQGNELYEGMEILQGQTIYVYASSEDGLCTDESSFTIDYEDCPIPRGISPNNDGLNDVFNLTPHGVESLKIYNRWGTEVYAHGEGYTTQWHGQNKSGKQLPDGTYYYVIQAHGKTRTGWVQINK